MEAVIFVWWSILFLPIILTLGGLLLLKAPPKDINSVYGYRTKSSSKSQEAWDFAQSFSGRIAVYSGAICLFVNLAVAAMFWKFGAEMLLNIFTYVIFGEMALSFGFIIFYTEYCLRKKF
ncbi:MAG: SdpI family protein [Clostridia bacterium]|nr:SdpI family protein [Clostridia bacterium]